MTWLFTLLAMAVIALVAGVVTGRISGGMDAPETSSPFRGLPPEGVTAEDVDAVRFTPAVRGYRMNEVDEVLDRMVQELGRRDEEIARLHLMLHGESYAPPPVAFEAVTQPDPVLPDPVLPGPVLPGPVPPGPVPPGASAGAATDPVPGEPGLAPETDGFGSPGRSTSAETPQGRF